jgi:aspartyl-tRNA(Asn)/glutamyl-tRNA(Gln) amidotransferase subunit B
MQYHAGRHKLLGFFVGQVMQATRGRANPKLLNQLLRAELERRS